MALTSADIAQMRLQHLDQIMRRKETVQGQIMLTRLFAFLFTILGILGAITSRNIACLIPIAPAVLFCIICELIFQERIQRFAKVYALSLEEGFEKVPDFAQLTEQITQQVQTEDKGLIDVVVVKKDTDETTFAYIIAGGLMLVILFGTSVGLGTAHR